MANLSANSGFFHIDRRIWKLLCDRDSINLATAYLTIAAGTGSSNRVSFWSAQAIEKYTGLHGTRATKAIGELTETGYLLRGESASRTRPVYEIQPYEKVAKPVKGVSHPPSLP